MCGSILGYPILGNYQIMHYPPFPMAPNARSCNTLLNLIGARFLPCKAPMQQVIVSFDVPRTPVPRTHDSCRSYLTGGRYG